MQYNTLCYILHYVYIHYVIYYTMQYNTLCNIIHYVYIYNIYNLTICRLGYVCNSRMCIIQLSYHSTALIHKPLVNVLFYHCR